MMSVRHRDWRLALSGVAFALTLAVAIPALASAQQVNSGDPAASSQALLERIAQLEKRIGELNAAKSASPETLVVMTGTAGCTAGGSAADHPQCRRAWSCRGKRLLLPVRNPANPEGNPVDSTNPEALLDRVKTLEQRVKELETNVVLSEPETRTKRIEVYVDPQGGVHDEPVQGARKTVTYQRERVYRRQTMSEQIESAIAGAEEHKVEVGVNAGIVAQFAIRTQGDPTPADNHSYELASADLFFTAGIAQNTLFFADLVGLGGTHPGYEIQTLTLVNGYAARLQNQNQISVREAWLRTEVGRRKAGACSPAEWT
jgi:hypothetical protein